MTNRSRRKAPQSLSLPIMKIASPLKICVLLSIYNVTVRISDYSITWEACDINNSDLLEKQQNTIRLTQFNVGGGVCDLAIHTTTLWHQVSV